MPHIITYNLVLFKYFRMLLNSLLSETLILPFLWQIIHRGIYDKLAAADNFGKGRALLDLGDTLV